MSESEWTKILGWPGYRVYRSEINEDSKSVRLWVRRKRGNRKLMCSGCGQAVKEIAEVYEREVRDLPCFEYCTTVVIELYRVRCPRCGVRAEKVPLLPSKAPFSKRFEEAVGQACESAAVRGVARQFALAASTVRAIDLRYLERWAQGRRRPALRQYLDSTSLAAPGINCAILSDMWSRASRITALVVLLTCLICPLLETFDSWDDTIQTGNDTEYTLVILALCIGIAYSFARFTFTSGLLFFAKSVFTTCTQKSFLSSPSSLTLQLFDATGPPLLPLRI